MSGNNIDVEKNRKRSLEKSTNADYQKKAKPADTNKVDVRIYLENKLCKLNRLTRNKLEEITMQTLCKLIDQHINTDKLQHELKEIKQKLASLQNKYNDLESQFTQISSSENNVLKTLDTMQNPNAIQFYPIRRTVAVQVERDAQVKPPVVFIDLTDEDESTSPNEATLTDGSKQVSSLKVGIEDNALGGDAISKIEKKPSTPKESQKSVV